MAIGVLCVGMVLLPLLAGALGAVSFSDVPMISSAGMPYHTERSWWFVTYRLSGGVVTTLLWYVLNGIDTMIR